MPGQEAPRVERDAAGEAGDEQLRRRRCGVHTAVLHRLVHGDHMTADADAEPVVADVRDMQVHGLPRCLR